MIINSDNKVIANILDPVGSKAMTEDKYAKIQRWLFGLAENEVTRAGSRATFVSDMYFDAGGAIRDLRQQVGRLTCEVTSLKSLLEDERRKAEEIIAEYVKETSHP